MKRTGKNILMIALCLLLAGTMVLTVFFARSRTDRRFDFSGQMPQGNFGGQMPGGEIPQMPEGGMPQMPAGDGNAEDTPVWNMPNQPIEPGEMSEGERPQMPEGGFGGQMPGGEMPQMPEGGFDGQMPGGEKPQMPEGGFGGQIPDGEIPQIPEGGFNGQMPDGEMPQMPEGGFEGQRNEARGNMRGSLSIIYYLILGAQALAFSLLLMFLLLSGFNKLGFRETFGSALRVVVYILCVLVLTAGLTLGGGLLARPARMTGGFGGPGGMGADVTYSSANEITEDTELTAQSIDSSAADENALSVSGAAASLRDCDVRKTGDSDGGDSTSFYGINSAVIARDGAVLTIEGGTITTDAVGANGVFSYGGTATTNNTSGDGTTVNISGTAITTSKDNSGGIMTTGGGVMNAENLTVTTAGISSAAIRTDRGGGTVTVDGGTYRTTGQGSPAIYSTANVTVRNAELIAETSEGAIIEGKNSITLENVTLTDNNCRLNGQSTTYKNIFLYQSMSGDAASGTAEFTADGCTVTTEKGDAIYVTNTNAVVNLKNTVFITNDPEGCFLRAQADSWGNTGSNGGIVTLNMESQTAQGAICADSVSSVDIVMKGSCFEGAINGDNTAKAMTLTLDADSRLTLTGDCYLTSFTNAQTDNSNIDFGGFTIYVNGKALN